MERVMPRQPHLDARRFAIVLDGVAFPAMRWQLWAEADHYGADAHTSTALHRLPAGRYPNLNAVLTALGAPLHNDRPARSTGRPDSD
jgi:hypothetical protein